MIENPKNLDELIEFFSEQGLGWKSQCEELTIFAEKLEFKLTEARAEVERKDRLVEQMKLALKTLRKYPHTYKMTGQGCVITDKDLEQCDALLSAAERQKA